MKRYSKNTNQKLVIMRRADSHRDATYTVGGRQKLPKEPITLPRVSLLERPDDDALSTSKSNGEAVSLGAVISLCDRTGNMVLPWAEAGYECWCFDTAHMPRKPRLEGNINFVWGDARTVKRPTDKPIAIVFGFSPCTDVAVCGARDFANKGGMMLRDALELFEAVRQIGEWSGAPYMLENPVGVLSSIPHIGKPNHYFHPCDFTAFELGDNYTKKTCLWTGNGFVMPAPARAPNLGKPDDRIHKATPGDDRGDIRSMTPMGFARAVFKANAPEAKRAAA